MAAISMSSRSAEVRWSTPATRSRTLAGNRGPSGERASRVRRAGVDAACVTVAFVLALGAFQVQQARIAGTWGFSSFPLDDSWIHLHFARNFAEGHGFAYNPGVPVGGSTAPLWTLVLAGAFALLGAQPFWAKVAG